jgi:hypothetical protein
MLGHRMKPSNLGGMRAQDLDSGHKKQRSKGGLTPFCVVIFFQQQAIGTLHYISPRSMERPSGMS